MKNRIKVMIVIRQLIVGGAESQTYELARGLDREKFEVTVCSLQNGGHFAKELEIEGIPVRVVRKRGKYDVSIIPRLITLFKQERPDIIHCVMWTANMWGGLCARLAGIPRLVMSTRSIGIWKKRIHYLTGPLIFNHADRVLANSMEVRNYMVQRESVNKNKIQVVYNGLDTGKFGKSFSPEEVQKIRKELGLPPMGPVIGIVANLSPQKDYPTLLQAAVQVAKANEDARFLIVGDGPLRASLQAETIRLGLEGRVVFTGLRTDVDRCLSCMDTFVLSSVREGFSNALLEAMAMGLPVVASRVGGNIEAVKVGESGYLFQPGDYNELARYILRLIGNPGQARIMGENGKKRAMRDFSNSHYLKQMENLYINLLN